MLYFIIRLLIFQRHALPLQHLFKLKKNLCFMIQIHLAPYMLLLMKSHERLLLLYRVSELINYNSRKEYDQLRVLLYADVPYQTNSVTSFQFPSIFYLLHIRNHLSLHIFCLYKLLQLLLNSQDFQFLLQ